MVQIVQAQPSRSTLRQQALMEGIQTAIGGMQALQQQGQTQRQQALQEQKMAADLREQGYDVSPEMVAQSLQQEPSGISKFFGAESPQKVDLYGKRTQEYQDAIAAKKAQQDEENKLAWAKLNNERSGQKAMLAQKEQVKEEKMPTADQLGAAGFAQRAILAENELKQLPKDVGTGFASGAQSAFLRGPLSAFKSDEQKQFEQTKNNFISSVLRKESGAAISDEEYAREEAKYFPAAGDSQKVLAQKERARAQAIANLKGQAGEKAFNQIAAISPSTQIPSSGRQAVAAPQMAPAKQQRLLELRKKAGLQ